MTDSQRKFADEYIIDCNASRAYRAAYPNIKNNKVAKTNGSRLLAKANIKAYIDEKLTEISNNKTAEATEIMQYLTSVLRGQSKASVVVIEGNGEGYSEARVLEKPPDEKERLKAAELLGKRYGLFTEKVKVDSVVPVVISGGEALED